MIFTWHEKIYILTKLMLPLFAQYFMRGIIMKQCHGIKKEEEEEDDDDDDEKHQAYDGYKNTYTEK